MRCKKCNTHRHENEIEGISFCPICDCDSGMVKERLEFLKSFHKEMSDEDKEIHTVFIEKVKEKALSAGEQDRIRVNMDGRLKKYGKKMESLLKEKISLLKGSSSPPLISIGQDLSLVHLWASKVIYFKTIAQEERDEIREIQKNTIEQLQKNMDEAERTVRAQEENIRKQVTVEVFNKRRIIKLEAEVKKWKQRYLDTADADGCPSATRYGDELKN